MMRIGVTGDGNHSSYHHGAALKSYAATHPGEIELSAVCDLDAGMIPNFLVIRAVGLYGSIWVYVIAALMSARYIFILRTFFSQMPDSIEESAKIDGAVQEGCQTGTEE